MFKHWSLFIEGEQDADKFLLHAVGSKGRFRFEERNANARQSHSISDVFQLCDVDTSLVGRVKEIARAVPIRNNVEVWNCQDYVLDLLELLEEANVVPRENARYQTRKKELKLKQDGLE